MEPFSVALVNDYPLVVHGLHRMLLPFRDRVRVVELAVKSREVRAPVDIALFDSFAHDRDLPTSLNALAADPSVNKVVLYTWAFEPELITAAIQAGAHGVLAKTLTGAGLLAALEQVHAGQRVISPRPTTVRDVRADTDRPDEWPGRSAGLTQREAEMMTLITRGHTNAEIASATYLSPNSVKSYIRSAYRKAGVERRSQAVAWGMENGLGRESAKNS